MTENKPHNKLGLALSGGGFRASFFHIGVLAQLAELGLLRHVQVISAVSGGSIIAALYYLHLQKLFHKKADHAIDDADYLAVVQTIEKEFLESVQRNMRSRTMLNPWKILDMIFPHYSRSDRIADLYDRHFYRPVTGRDRFVEMRDLIVNPKDHGGEPFHPDKHNPDRNAPVPILLLNATTLNTGHNWRFEATRMGEPEHESDASFRFDKNLRLLCASTYADIIEKQQDFPLGHGVAASACVPLLFPPLSITGMYPDIRVQLVDGGVHDNQGIEGLNHRECTHVIISDASGQMKDDKAPKRFILPVLNRTTSILMDRVREEELLRMSEKTSVHNRLMHLRKDLPPEQVCWFGPDGTVSNNCKPHDYSKFSPKYGVSADVQKLISEIRTDLDSFSDIEAFSIMMDGYMMSRHELQGDGEFSTSFPPKPADRGKAKKPRFEFLAIERFLKAPTEAYKKHLEVGSNRAFKVFRLHGALAWAVFVGTYGLVLGAVSLALWKFSTQLRAAGLYVLAVVAGILIYKFIQHTKHLTSFKSFLLTLLRIPFRVGAAIVMPVVVGLHLLVFDRIFLSGGKLDRLK